MQQSMSHAQHHKLADCYAVVVECREHFIALQKKRRTGSMNLSSSALKNDASHSSSSKNNGCGTGETKATTVDVQDGVQDGERSLSNNSDETKRDFSLDRSDCGSL